MLRCQKLISLVDILKAVFYVSYLGPVAANSLIYVRLILKTVDYFWKIHVYAIMMYEANFIS